MEPGVLDENGCPVPVRTCKLRKQKILRQKRQAAATAPQQCPQNAEWRNCTSICPELSCQNYQLPQDCFSLRCGAPGCVCKDGYLLLNFSNKQEGCVKKESCPQQTTQAATSG
ncbi:trypsin Inhibitor like cysteine rich domain protein [Ancylostoma caninum]|uniref:Trypsin Inhibitor like cysteine rich domain protein n=1 Tax=Ancylostoma caninum TaxID=29170 RepID=A0A368GYT7_ANCCA|nr:trypsin Inhibitor like cysteine rich domain protein [Ancylostoma caninum]